MTESHQVALCCEVDIVKSNIIKKKADIYIEDKSFSSDKTSLTHNSELVYAKFLTVIILVVGGVFIIEPILKNDIDDSVIEISLSSIDASPLKSNVLIF